jgi:hypothetical protein
VQGEFYWRVQRDERARVSDYDAGRKRLSREETRGAGGSEVTWSAGEAVDAAALAKAFGLPPGAIGGVRRDSAPIARLTGSGIQGGSVVIWIVVLVFVVLFIMDSCSDDCDDVKATFGASSAEYQQCKASGGTGVRRGGGSFGGWSTGGGHK